MITKIFPIFILIFAINVQAAGGGMDSSGGDSCALEFREIADNIHLDIMRKKLNIDIQINHKDFLKAIRTTKVSCVNHAVKCQNEEKDACNTPSVGLIEVDRFRWDAISLSARKYQLVFHEYLGILKIDDQNGKVSNIYLKPQENNSAVYTGGNSVPVATAFNAESGSALERYDTEAKDLIVLYKIDDLEGVMKKSIAILKKYFGFTEIILKNQSKNEITTIYNIAVSLRSILPADFKDLSYIGIQGEINSRIVEQYFIIEGNSGVEYRLVIDQNAKAFGFAQKIEGVFTKSYVCELRLDGVPGIVPFYGLKGLMAQMINCFNSYYSPIYDIQRQ